MSSANYHGKARRMSSLQVARRDSSSPLLRSNLNTPTSAIGLPADLKRRASVLQNGVSSPMASAGGKGRRGSVEEDEPMARTGRRMSVERLDMGQGSSGRISRDDTRDASRERSAEGRRSSIASLSSQTPKAADGARRGSISHKPHHADENASEPTTLQALSSKGAPVGSGRT